MITFISDLDKTLIYSREYGNKCVEYVDGVELSFMTDEAYEVFMKLISRNDFNFIPCTARSFEQAMRLSFIGEKPPKYMVCDLGASIYVNGFKEVAWERFLAKQGVLNKRKINEFRDIANNKFYLSNCRKIVSNNDYFLVYCYRNVDEAKEFYRCLNGDNIVEGLKYYLSGKKVYVLPENLDKSIAIRHLLENVDMGKIVTSGDSVLDAGFVRMGDKICLPKHAEFSLKGEVRSNRSGILSGEDIVKEVAKVRKKRA